MANPICVVYFPIDFTWMPNGQIVRLNDLMAEFNGWDRGERFSNREPLGGYFWLCFFKEGITEPEIQVKKTTSITKKEVKELTELFEKYKAHVTAISNK